MSHWYERMTELREEKHKKQQDIADEIGVDYTAYNRYENGNTQNISRGLEKKLLKFFSMEEVKYIKLGVAISQEGDENCSVYGDNNNIKNGFVNDDARSYKKLPSEIQTIVDVLIKMDTKRRLDVLHCVLELRD